EDYYIKRVANMAYDEKPVPDADEREMEVFRKARQNALGKYFDEEKWKQAVKEEEWKKVVYVLNRGGRFEAAGNEYVNKNKHIKIGMTDNFLKVFRFMKRLEDLTVKKLNLNNPYN